MRRRVVSWMLGAYAVALGILVFAPTGPSLEATRPFGISAGALEAAANVAIFIPNVRDVVANSTGALIGALCGSLWLRFRRPRSPERLPEAGTSLSESSIRS